MLILQGFVQGVKEKGEGEKRYAVVAIDNMTKDKDGFDKTELVKFMVGGEMYKQGLHNAYRQAVGSEVFAPYSDEINVFNGKSSIRYNLQGIPLRLQEARPVQSAPAAAQAVGAK